MRKPHGVGTPRGTVRFNSRFFSIFAAMLLALFALGAHATTPTLTGDYWQSVYIGYPTNGAFTINWTGGDLGAMLEAQTAPYGQSTATNKTTYSIAAGARSISIPGKAPGVYYYTGFLGVCPYCAVTNDIAIIAYNSVPVMSSSLAIYAGNTLPISWTTVVPATGYQLEQQVNGGAWAVVYTGNVASYTTPALAVGTYNFRVHPCYGYICAAFTSGTFTTAVLSQPTLTGGDWQSIYIGYPTNGSFNVNWSGGDLTWIQESQGAPTGQAGATNQVGYQIAAGARSLNIAGKAPGVYYYNGVAGNCYACLGTNNIAVILYNGVPVLTAPATNSTGNFTLSWTTLTPANGYWVEQQLNGGSWSTIYQGSAASYAVSVTTSGSYNFRVHPCYGSVCAAGIYGGTATTVSPPVAPNNLTLPPTSITGTYSLTWNSVQYATSYQVDQSLNLGPWTTIYNGAGTGTNLFGMADGFYVYQVRACSPVGCSANSTIQYISVLHVPVTPTLTTPSTNASGQFTTSWTAASTATSYQLDRRFSAGAWSTVLNSNAITFAQSGLPVGTYDYQVRACNASGCSPNSAIATTTVSNTTTIPYSQTPVPFASILSTLSQADIDNSDKVGSTEGQFRVDESGAATYKIPLFTTPGTAGVTPQLSLNYSSQGGNGQLGQGWTLGGLSDISRCRQTKQQDNNPLPITWSNQDRFCLDGQRLILVSLGSYGDPNTIYKTEIDTYATITALGGTSGHPNYWKVEKKDGSISFYGDAPASRDPNAGPMGSAYADGKIGVNSDPTKIYTWRLRKFQDSAGNAIWYEYGWYYGWFLSEVRYAYGMNAGPDNYGARVQFNYEGRGDLTNTGYVAGYGFTGNALRINKINIENAGTVVRAYNLAYKEQETFTVSGQSIPLDLSRMTSVQECATSAAGANVCKPATQFTWSDTSQQIGFNFNTSVATNLGVDARGRFITAMSPVDIDGDGCTDLVWLESAGNGWAFRYAMSNCLGGWTPGVFDNGASELTNGIWGAPASLGYANSLTPIDFNGDGRIDIALPYSQKVAVSVRQADGSWRLSANLLNAGMQLGGESIQLADMNSDGLVDNASLTVGANDLQIQYLTHDTSQAVNSNTFYHYGPVQHYAVPGYPASRQYHWILTPQELNGDGINDLPLIYTDACPSAPWSVCLVFPTFDGVSVSPATGLSLYFDGNGPIPYYSSSNYQLADLNGDGLADVMMNGFYGVNTGAGFANTVTSPYPSWPNGITQGDYNGDSSPDLVWWDGTKIQINLWNKQNQNFDATITPFTKTATKMPMLLDVNGDGVVDYVDVSGSKGDVLTTYMGNGAFQPRQVIMQITNGLGASTAITYESLARTTHYTHLTIGSSQGNGLPCPTFVGTLNANFPYMDYPCNYVEPDAASFYTALNDSWKLPVFSQTLGKDSNVPALEFLPPTYVVTSIKGSAPAATNAAALGSMDNNATSQIDYYYGEAKIQAGGRGLLGFHSITTKDIQSGVVTQNTYRQDFPFIGYPMGTKVYIGNQLIRASINYWAFQNFNTPTTGAHAVAPYRPVLATTYDWSYDPYAANNALMTAASTTNTYDAFGNVLTVQVDRYSDLNLTALVASKLTTNTYGSDDTMRRFGRLTRTVVSSSRPSAATITRTSAFTYYCMGTGPCNSSNPNQNRLLAQEIIEPDQAAPYKLTTTYEYDTMGNRTKATVSAVDVADRYTRGEYDALGRFKNRTFNGLEQKVEEVVQRNALGQPEIVNGLNNTQAQFRYGAFGHKYVEYSNAGSYATTMRYLNLYPGQCPNGVAFADWVTKGGGGDNVVCYDKLARPMRQLTRAFDGSLVMADTEYDKLGRVIHKTIPYFNGDSRYPATLPFTNITYDILGRVSNTKAPDGTVSTALYEGLKTTYTDPKAHKKIEMKNALGELDYVQDHNGSQIKYQYNADGSLAQTIAKAGSGGVASIARANGVPNADIATVFTYDAVGRKLTMSDPDKGTWTYAYYSNGELKKQIDAKGQMIEFQYDKLGRTVNRVDCTSSATSPCPTANQPSNTTWTYDTAPNGVGQLDNVQDSKTGYVKALAYDTLGRTVQTVISPAANENYYQRVNFDQYGRVYQQYDASATLNGVTNVYNASGYLTQLADAASNQPYYLVNAMDALGHITNESNGAATTVRTYDATMGRLQTIASSVINLNAQTGSITTQNFAYGYDAIGNMTSRKDVLNNNLTETFVYDEVNRLYSDQVGTAAAATINYDSFGNIATKSGLSYTYGAGAASSGCTSGNGVHAAINVSGTAYTYDCNGNNLSGDGRTLQYSVFDKPTSINKGTFTATFKYDADRNLLKRIDNNNGALTTTVYIGNVEKVIKPDNSYELRRYIAGAIVTMKYNSGGVLQSSTNQYVLKDHLGSTDVIIDQHGTVVQGSGNTTKQKQSFDPWGMRRDTATWVPLTTSLLAQFDHSTTNKGFTGHEMVDELGIIHMGGRIYDPRIGRFLQADPFIDAPTSTQNYNRYSYLGNNPVNGIDPSGYHGFDAAEWVGDHMDQIVDTIILAVMAHVCGYCAVPVAAGLAASQTYVYSGSYWQALKAGAIVGASAFAFAEIGDQFADTSAADFAGANPEDASVFAGMHGDTALWLTPGQFAAKIAEEAVVGGVMSSLQGGKFGSGFIGAGVAAGFAPQLSQIGGGGGFSFKQVVAASVLGGTASAITGGKFANGAMTAAFENAFNQQGQENSKLDKARRNAYSSLPYGSDVKNEWGRYIYQVGDDYYLGPLVEGTSTSTPFQFSTDGIGAFTPDGDRIVEFTHTHPNRDLMDNGNFSRQSGRNLGDVGLAEKYHTNISMRYGDTLRIYEPATTQPTRSSFGGYENSPGRQLCATSCF